MRTKPFSVLKTTLYLFFMLLSALRSYGQTDVTIGSGTGSNGGTTYPAPLQDYWEGNRAQYLYKASELIAKGIGPGFINAIRFKVTDVNGCGIIEQYSVKISATTTASLNDVTWEPSGTVIFGPLDYQPVVGLNSFPCTPAFFWNGVDNILVEVCSGDPNNPNGPIQYTNNAVVAWTDGLSFNGSKTYHDDNEGSLCSTIEADNSGNMDTRPDIIFNWTPAVACSGTPNAGTAVTSVSSVCLNENFTLSLTGVTVASGLKYQWQSSPNNATWTNILNDTTAALTTTQLASTYYRCVVTCTASGASATSTAVQVTSPTLVSGTFSINKALPTGGGNFASFNDAYNYIKCGINGAVVFNVVAGSGPYNEQLNMVPVPGASATNTVTFNGNADTLAYLSTNSNEREVIKLNGADYIHFVNLVINAKGSSSSEYGFAVQLINDADFNSFTNCTILSNKTSTSTNFAGIVISSSASSATATGSPSCDNNIFTGNTIIGGYYGMTIVASSTTSNAGNLISNNKFRDFYNYGMYILGAFNTTIQGNIFSRPTRTSVSDYYGIYLTGLSTKVNINANRFTDPFGGAPTSTNTFYGIYFSSVDALSQLENVVSNNLMYNLSGKGSVYGIYNYSSDNVWFYHNTLSLDGAATSSTYVTRGFYQTSTAAGINFIDNLITITRSGPGTKHAIYFASTSSVIVSNYNNLFISPTVTNAFTGYNGSNQATMANWRTAALQDANSIATNPIYADITTGNYAPTSAAANDRGTPMGILTDINNAARSTTTPDMGAYEFTPAVCTAPPVAGAATINITPVCSGVPVSLNLNGNSMGLTQTYQWQYSPTATGTYTNLGLPINFPDTTINATSTLYYRAAVTCGSSTTYSDPVLLTVNPALPGNTYSIDKNAPASALNFVSFNAAKAAMACGISGPVIFNVVAGRTPYEEQLSLDSIRGVSAINTITFLGNGNTIHFSSSNTDERAVIKLKRSDYITFDSLTIDATGTGTYGYGVQLINYADSNTFRKCNIIANTTSTSDVYAGIVMNASDNGAAVTGSTRCTGNTFNNNIITGGYYGVTVVGGDSDPIIGNRFTGNTVKDFYNYGFYLYYPYNTQIRGNLITRPTRTGVSTFDGIYVNGQSGLLNISGNRITNPFGGVPTSTSAFYGIAFSSSDAPTGATNIVANNVIYNINGQGSAYGIYNGYSANASYYHNTISIDNNNGSSTFNTLAGFYQSGTTSELKFINNIITVTAPALSPKYAIYEGSTGTEIVANNNDYYVKGGGAANTNNTGYFGANYTTLADWKIATGQDAASVSMDPIYADAANGNLAPAIVQMDNTGVPVGITNDILGVLRSTTKPDIGAYEIDIPLCHTPLNPGTAVVTPTSGICLGKPITLDLTGNTPGGRLTYQWQSGFTANGPWINITDTMYVSLFKTELGMNNYFRCRIVCSGTDTAYSTVAYVNMNAPLIKGLYTINPAGSGPRNFPSFTAAVQAMECGIAGEVIFEAVPGTYTEQVRMHKVGGASDTSRITFRSQNGDPASVILTYATTAALNYVLKLDSASYVTYKNLTIKAAGTTSARVVELAGTAAYDSLLYNKINMPATTTNNTNIVGIYANAFPGKNITIMGNTFTNGASGIWFSGPSNTLLSPSLMIDSNTVNGAYVNGIYTLNTTSVAITRNTVNSTAPLASTSYGIALSYGDSAYRVTQNKVNISNATTTVYGIYLEYCAGTLGMQGLVAANKVYATTGNTGSLYGLDLYYSSNNTTVNNVVGISTSGSSSYALYSYLNNNINYYNNTFQSTATSSTNKVAGYLYHTSATYGNIRLRNNIFSHLGGGYALLVYSPDYINSDYNTLYTSGATLIRQSSTATNYTTLADWRTASDLDISSIVYKPAFVSNTDLTPDVNNPDVWAIHGRGVQVTGNDHDINNQYRPVTLAEGVPDMGAYEFLPAVEPPLLQPIPLTPAAGTTQRFMFGTDTVAKITWSPSAAVPTDITLKRYSGIKPPKLATGREFMYFYTDMDANGPGGYHFDLQQFYVDSWQGTMDKEMNIRLGRTGTDSIWQVNDSSTVDVTANIIADTSLKYIDRFTGLKGNLPDKPTIPAMPDSSNRGTRFWVGYGHHQFFGTDNSQSMVLYLSADQLSHVTVKVNGTSWKKEYTVPARNVVVTDLIPKNGLSDARLLVEGLSDKGISIESDAPIVAYAHIYGSASSGATMLLPVGTYGYEYYALMSHQSYGSNDNTYSWFFVVADNDNTMVEITPSTPTLNGRPAGVPFTITLNKGEIYQVLGAIKSSAEGYDLSGSKIRSVSNANGKCYPVGVFSGNSRTSLSCDGMSGTSGDNNIQQNFPSQAWGQHYLTAPTSNSEDATLLATNIYRVMVKDTATAVFLNGTRLRGLINGRYYQYESGTADYVEADKPVTVAQYLSSEGACPNTDGDGDPEIFYLSPIEQGINSVGLYRNNVESINENYLTLITPTSALPSLMIDGANTYDYSYAHPNKSGYTVVVKRWLAAKAQCIVTSDSAFTAITYGLGSVESYGYNAGTLVRNLNMKTTFSNTYDSSGTPSKYTCAKTPFRFTAMLPVKPTSLKWELSQVNNLIPSADVMQTNPVPLDSIEANGKTYYKYNLSSDYMFTTPGTYYIPLQMSHPDIESCNNTSEVMLEIKVIGAPLVDFSIDYSGCISDEAILDGQVVTENNAAINIWKWNFADGTNAYTSHVTRKYPAAGTYVEELHIITAAGCIGDTSKQVVVNDPGSAKMVKDTITVCYGASVTFSVQNPDPALTYNWYNAAINGALLGTGTSFTVPSAVSKAIYYVETVMGGCPGSKRTPATLLVLPVIVSPVVTVDSIGVNAIRFKWDAVTAATGYEVSIDNGVTWTTPSSGPLGLEHLVTGLKPVQTVTLLVKAKGCNDKISDPVSAVTLTDGIYIPNAFSPNGDGLNDVLQVYGAIIKEVHFMIFNQWGEKVFETNNQSVGWDGYYKRKAQPSGVYMYVCKLKLLDGTEVDRKGSVNLIR